MLTCTADLWSTGVIGHSPTALIPRPHGHSILIRVRATDLARQDLDILTAAALIVGQLGVELTAAAHVW